MHIDHQTSWLTYDRCFIGDRTLLLLLLTFYFLDSWWSREPLNTEIWRRKNSHIGDRTDRLNTILKLNFFLSGGRESVVDFSLIFQVGIHAFLFSRYIHFSSSFYILQNRIFKTFNGGRVLAWREPLSLRGLSLL